MTRKICFSNIAAALAVSAISACTVHVKSQDDAAATPPPFNASIKRQCIKLGMNIAVSGGINLLIINTIQDTK